jgi:hypothetical protein
MSISNKNVKFTHQKLLESLIILSLFILGGIMIGFTLNWGNIPFDFLDWSQEGPRFLFLKQSLAEGKLPLFIESPMIETERFLGIPDTLFAPQVIFLSFLKLGEFILFNAFLNYAFGFFILTRIKKRLGWSLAPFLMTVPLLLLNGFILSHLAVGHTMWVNAFLLPWLFLLYLSAPSQGIDWRWILQFSLFSLVLFLQGGFHFALWSWGFFLLVGILKNTSIKSILLSILFSILTALFRILPAGITFIDNDRRFIAGFRTLADLVRALVSLQLPEEAQTLMNSGLPNWETNFYIGLLGGLFILWFAIVLPMVQKEKQRRFSSLWMPILILSVLSMGQIFRFINLLPFGWAQAERVSSRFFYIPLILLIVIAGDSFNRWWSNHAHSSQRWLILVCAEVILLHDLVQHARLWRVARLQTIFEPINIPLIGQVVSRSDQPYITALVMGASVSTLCLILLIVLSILTKKISPSENKSENDLLQ